jgi:hypothetical protein
VTGASGELSNENVAGSQFNEGLVDENRMQPVDDRPPTTDHRPPTTDHQLLTTGHRLCLHAARLGFHHPATGEWTEFVSLLPDDLQEIWQSLKNV